MARPNRPSRHGRVREAAAHRHSADPQPEKLAGVLLDSDGIIEILRGRPSVVKAAIEIDREGIATYTCAISWAEIFAGIRPGEEEITEEFFHARGEVLLDSVSGRRAGSYLARHGKSHGLQIADALIAAAATTSGLLLWTLNRKHYPMADLKFFEPASSRS